MRVWLVCLMVTSCACGGGSGQQARTPDVAAAATPTPPPTLVLPLQLPKVINTPTPVRSPVATSQLPPPTPRRLASPTPVAPTLPLRISAQLNPPAPRAGEEFVLALTVANDGERPAQGVYIATSGPWDRWTVLDVQPSGSFGRDAAGWHIASPIQIPPRAIRTVEVRIRAQEPSEEQLTFAVREAEPGELST